MSKYSPLTEFLKLAEGELEMPFAGVEKVLGFALPRSARLYPAWWSNSGGTHVQSAAWQSAGYETRQVDVENETVRFVPMASKGFEEMQQAAFNVPGQAMPVKHPLFGCMKGSSIVLPGVDLTAPADPDWGKVYEDDYPQDDLLASPGPNGA